jgi:purine-nucleoside phosphorylase
MTDRLISENKAMQEGVKLIQARSALRPKIGLVLGSGLGAFASSLERATRIPYSEIPGLPISTAIGHAGELVLGSLGNVDLAVMSGRFHLYEGYRPQQVVAGVRLFKAMGISRLVLTNAAGGIDVTYGRGALVLISDHINLQGVNPLCGPNDNALGPRFPDMTEAYSLRLRGIAAATGKELGITLREGVYAGLLGPCYETPAEIRFLKTIGADLVGMSTVAETIAANHMKMEVLGISCVTNLAAGLSGEKLDQDEVLEIGRQVSGTFLQLLNALLPRLDNL